MISMIIPSNDAITFERGEAEVEQRDQPTEQRDQTTTDHPSVKPRLIVGVSQHFSRDESKDTDEQSLDSPSSNQSPSPERNESSHSKRTTKFSFASLGMFNPGVQHDTSTQLVCDHPECSELLSVWDSRDICSDCSSTDGSPNKAVKATEMRSPPKGPSSPARLISNFLPSLLENPDSPSTIPGSTWRTCGDNYDGVLDD